LSEPEFQKYCIHARFVGDIQQVPRDFGTPQMVLRMVGLIPVQSGL
jgi:hypothetical protein